MLIAGLKNALPSLNSFHRVDQIVLGGVFQQICARTGLQGLQDIALVGMHAQKHDRRMRQFRRNLPRCLDAVQSRHRDIHHHNIGSMLLGKRDRLAAISGIRDHLKIRLAFEQQP